MACRKARTKSKKEIHQTSGARTQTAGSPISAHCKPHYCHQKKCQTLENAPGHTAYITAVHQTLLSCGRAILLQVVMEKALQTAFYTFVNISSLFLALTPRPILLIVLPVAPTRQTRLPQHRMHFARGWCPTPPTWCFQFLPATLKIEQFPAFPYASHAAQFLHKTTSCLRTVTHSCKFKAAKSSTARGGSLPGLSCCYPCPIFSAMSLRIHRARQKIGWANSPRDKNIK